MMQSSAVGSHQELNAQALPETRRTKVLYLDFDGVLHHSDVRWRPRIGAFLKVADYFLFEHASLLEVMLRPHPDLAIVLSTSWVIRYGCAKAAKRLPSGLRERVVGATFHSEMDIRLFEAMSRGRQVMADVARRRPYDWFALDDTDEGWPDEFRDHIIITHGQLGIASPDVVTRIHATLHRMYPGQSSSEEFAR